jgi:hypothetical protein
MTRNDFTPASAAEIVEFAIQHHAYGLNIWEFFQNSLAVVDGRAELGPTLRAVAQLLGLDHDIRFRYWASGTRGTLRFPGKPRDRVLSPLGPLAPHLTLLLVGGQPAPQLLDLLFELLPPLLDLLQLELQLLVFSL